MAASSFQDRLKEEAYDLDKKREKLLVFLSGETFHRLGSAEKDRMRIQYTVMTLYSEILYQRIAAFPGVEEVCSNGRSCDCRQCKGTA